MSLEFGQTLAELLTKFCMTTNGKEDLVTLKKYTEEKENVKTGNSKQKKVFKAKRPLSIPVKFVNYEPAFKFKMNKNQTSNSVESENKSSEESILVFNKPNSSETKVYLKLKTT